MVKEACDGPSSLACSASTLVKFLKNHGESHYALSSLAGLR